MLAAVLLPLCATLMCALILAAPAAFMAKVFDVVFNTVEA